MNNHYRSRNAGGEKIIHITCPGNGAFPNNENLDLCIFRQVLSPDTEKLADAFEKRFTENYWPPVWRNGLYDFHHFHSTAHEVLGVYAGWSEACFGGPGGVVRKVSAGDVLVIPAGVSHKNVGQSQNFRAVGAYPEGQRWNMKYGNSDERPQVEKDISRVSLPVRDPVYGATGPLMTIWGCRKDSPF